MSNNAKQFIVVIGFVVIIMGVGLIQLNSYPSLEETIGKTLVDRRGNEVPITDIGSRKYILLYFSASWCPPCRRFTPKLSR